MDRYSVTAGMYNQFDCGIRVDTIENTPVLYHEYYHHIQNVSTMIGGERFNLLVQFLVQLHLVFHKSDEVKVPLNRWYEIFDPVLDENPALKALNNLVSLQDEWIYLDKQLQDPILIKEEVKSYDEHVYMEHSPQTGMPDGYIMVDLEGLKLAIPIGAHILMESGAYALELWHRGRFDDDSIVKLDMDHYPYTILTDVFYKKLGDVRLTCLATFLFCDLALIIGTPTMGFLQLYLTASRLFTIKKLDEEKLLLWYEASYSANEDLIMNMINEELKMIERVEEKMEGLSEEMTQMLNYQISLMKAGLSQRKNENLKFVKLLVSQETESITELMKKFPMTIIETTKDGNIRYKNESDVTNFEMLNGTYQLFLGLCRNPSILLESEFVKHLKVEEDRLTFKIAQSNGMTDANGHLISILGLDGKSMSMI